MSELPLTDRFRRIHNYLRISVTDRCNFRCRYCMPPEGLEWKPRGEILTFEEIERLARLFAGLGVDKIRLTGGEPTVRKGIESLIERLSSIPGIDSLHMTTNGTTLASKASEYRRAGLTGINISLDSLKREKFAAITLRDELPRVLKGIESTIAAGFESVKVNVVVMAGVNDDEILDFVEFAVDRPILVRFIEFMPFAGNGWSANRLVPYRQMREMVETRYRLAPIPVERSAVGKDFSIENAIGSVGFVTSMSENFCSDCNRLRLTAEGSFKVCLFAAEEADLRGPLRTGASDDELEALIRAALDRKWRGHPSLDLLPQVLNRSMVAIGG